MNRRYGQLYTDDFFKADEAGLGRELGLVVAWMAQSGQDTLPFKEFQKAAKKLEGIGIKLSLKDVLGAALANRLRQEKHRSKIKQMDDNRNVTQNVTADVTGDVTGDGKRNVTIYSHSSSLSSSPSEKSQEKPARPSAPRYAVSKKECMRQWNAAVTAVTGEASCQTSLALETKAQEFHKAVSAAGETFEDVVRRRVRLGRTRLGLWSAMNDYNDDVRAEKATGPRPVAKANEQGDWLGIPKGKVAP